MGKSGLWCCTSLDAAPMIFFASLVIHEAWEMRRQSTFIMPIETAGIAAPYLGG